MSKYVIKNSPAYSTFYPDTGDEPFTACDAGLPLKKCQDCTDCLLKKIVKQAGYCLCPEILELLDIEEVE